MSSNVIEIARLVSEVAAAVRPVDAADLRYRAARQQVLAASSPRAFYLSPTDALADSIAMLEEFRATQEDDPPDITATIDILSGALQQLRNC